MKLSSARTRFDLVEVVLMLAFVALVVWLAKPQWLVQMPDPSREVQAFEQRFGPSRHSQHVEEWLIRDFFGDKRDGVFVDVGANHHERFSNTWYLEKELGWSGIAVEPLRSFEAGYQAHRPRTKFRAFFVADRSDEEATLYVPGQNSLMASSSKAFAETYERTGSEVVAPTITLTDLLEREGLERIDFLNMDIELAEPKALAGFDIERFRPSLVCIEAHPERSARSPQMPTNSSSPVPRSQMSSSGGMPVPGFAIATFVT